ncbi:hypothetical protein FA15DRAFT_669155 [Coprinopsis marcescibilis]|uniref:Uncharacterized protein n=1 Tax=Coprinopsis marcescibilis TaxID=230819 RepID=A0A5C3KWX1_COPMA|nr:hypothetical protein FA15DRAFT_669155 [Coprinopsis marcescibilis]
MLFPAVVLVYGSWFLVLLRLIYCATPRRISSADTPGSRMAPCILPYSSVFRLEC